MIRSHGAKKWREKEPVVRLLRRLLELLDAVEAKVEVEILGQGVAQVHAGNVGHSLFDHLEVVDGLARLRRTGSCKK